MNPIFNFSGRKPANHHIHTEIARIDRTETRGQFFLQLTFQSIKRYLWHIGRKTSFNLLIGQQQIAIISSTRIGREYGISYKNHLPYTIRKEFHGKIDYLIIYRLCYYAALQRRHTLTPAGYKSSVCPFTPVQPLTATRKRCFQQTRSTALNKTTPFFRLRQIKRFPTKRFIQL